MIISFFPGCVFFFFSRQSSTRVNRFGLCVQSRGLFVRFFPIVAVICLEFLLTPQLDSTRSVSWKLLAMLSKHEKKSVKVRKISSRSFRKLHLSFDSFNVHFIYCYYWLDRKSLSFGIDHHNSRKVFLVICCEFLLFLAIHLCVCLRERH